MRELFFILLFYSFLSSSAGTVYKIDIQGNKITKRHIVLRELTFKIGDSISSNDYAQKTKNSRNNLLNSTLFNFATIDFIDSLEFINVRINVVERWYLWPELIIKFQDRNFTEWYKTRNFSRIDYGLDITRKNFRGRQEILQFQFKYGFNKKIGVNYQIPYFNSKLKSGFKIGISYNSQNEVFTSIDGNNKMYYLKNPEKILLETYNGHIEYLIRNNFYIRHFFMADYTELHLHDSLAILGDNYASGVNKKQFVTFVYLLKRDRRDSRNYPLNGNYLDLELEQNGIGIDQSNLSITSISCNYRKYHILSPYFNYSIGAYIKAFSKANVPFYFQDGLGYNQYVRGYEPYIIYGQVNTVLKNNFKIQVLKPKAYQIKFIKNERFSKVHYAIYCNVFVDMGYVYQTQSRSKTLENQFLIGSGIGLDFVSFYDLVWRAEYSINKNLQHGLYISFVAPI